MTVEMADTRNNQSKFWRLLNFLLNSYLRLLAVIFFAGTLYTWLATVGFWEGANFRFDTMSVELKIYSAVMLVMLPVTSVGLWTTLAWGRVIWLFAITFQSVSILRFPDIIIQSRWVLLFHAVCLVSYLILQGMLYVIDKKE